MKVKITPEFTKKYKMLNPAQKRAVDAIEGPVMVIAGPGTGKTQILTLRIANILRKTDTPADAILALTFTEAAAANMKRRLVAMIGPEGYKVRVHTFHGFANSLIQDYPDGFPRFVGSSAMTDIEKLLLIARILDAVEYKELKPFYDNHAYLKNIMGAISSLKRDGILPGQFASFIEQQGEEFYARDDLYNKKTGILKTAHKTFENKIKRSKELARVYASYEERLQEERLYDFEDMILEVVKMMREDQDFKLQVQENFLYVLADEHQDANDAQNALLELLTDFHDSPNLFIVGDEKQAIYRFQGASLQNFLYFKDKFKDVTLVELQDSYRSGQEILDAGYKLMESMGDDIKRVKLASKVGITGAEVSLKVYSDDNTEALLVAKQIRGLIDDGVEPSEIAILHRTNADADPIARALSQVGVQYSIESDTNALEDRDLRKFLLLLQAIAHFGDDELLARALHADFLSLDELDIYKVTKAYRRARGKSLHDILLDEKVLKSLSLKNLKQMQIFAKRFIKFAKRAKQESVAELINEALEQFGFLSFALARPNSFDLLEKLRALLKDAETMASGNLDYTLKDFIEHLELLQRHGLAINKSSSGANKHAVKLYTAHKSKGLEFEHVFLVRAYDGKWGTRRSFEKFLLPVQDTTQDQDDADERRLFFVALTRAKLAVHISYGLLSDSQKERLPSKFITALEGTYIDKTAEAEIEEGKLSPQEFLKVPERSSKTFADVDFLQGLFIEQGLSVTALNNFIDCPWKFFYSNLIRIPKMPTKYMLLGNAVHFALDILHQGANKGKSYTDAELRELLKDFLRSKTLSEQVYNEALEKADEYFFDWLTTHKSKIGKYKTLNEYKVDTEFETGFPELPQIRLTGMLDKVELLSDTKVRVTDYKTGKPKSRNEIIGKNKSASGDYYRQLQFYKFLLELEGKYNLQEAVLDFVQRKDNGKMIQEAFTDSELTNLEGAKQTYEGLKEKIKETTKSIYNLDFWNDRCKNHEKGKCEYCQLRDMI